MHVGSLQTQKLSLTQTENIYDEDRVCSRFIEDSKIY